MNVIGVTYNHMETNHCVCSEYGVPCTYTLYRVYTMQCACEYTVSQWIQYAVYTLCMRIACESTTTAVQVEAKEACPGEQIGRL